MLNRANILIFETPQKLAEAAAEEFVKLSAEAIKQHGRFSVALAGGETPRKTYEAISSPNFQNRVDWSRVHLFFGDERFVPLDHPESNYRMVTESFISRVDIPPENVHPIRIADDPANSARLYGEELRGFFQERPWPKFDLILLGLGKDGHAASLFPNTSALMEQHQWVVANRVQGKPDRITLTVPAINNAAHIIFLVTGKDKAEIAAQVIDKPDRDENLPATLINPTQGSLTWFIDREAAFGFS